MIVYLGTQSKVKRDLDQVIALQESTETEGNNESSPKENSNPQSSNWPGFQPTDGYMPRLDTPPAMRRPLLSDCDEMARTWETRYGTALINTFINNEQTIPDSGWRTLLGLCIRYFSKQETESN